jgi:site-specific recombinase XerD
MKTKKNIRSDNTYIISTDSTDNPKLGAKILKDGRGSLFLDYYFGYTKEYDASRKMIVARKQRKRKYLKLYLWNAPKNPEERRVNKQTLMLAKRIRFEKGQEMLDDKMGYRLKMDSKINFLDYFKLYIDNYTKKDVRIMRMALRRSKDFLVSTPRYERFAEGIMPDKMDKDMMVAFTEYLQQHSVGEGAKAVYQRFKKVVKYAIEHGKMTKNPCTGVTLKTDEQMLRKEVLSLGEVQRLAATLNEGGNVSVRKAFMLCLYSGLRFCDVRDQTYANVDYANALLRFEQNKTRGHSSSSGVVIPLNDGLLRLIGTPTEGQDRESRIFRLPSYVTCLHELKAWMEQAEINKHITWHCARHSFAVNVLNNGANIKTVASLLGHSGLRHTEKYTRAVDQLKKQAINSLPELEI